MTKTIPQKLMSLYRKPEDGWLFGVVAGLCEVMGWRLRVTRVVIIILALFFGLGGLFAVAYLAAVLLLPTADEVFDAEPDPRVARAQRKTANLGQRFEDIGERLDRVESYLHSAEARLRRKFADLEA